VVIRVRALPLELVNGAPLDPHIAAEQPLGPMLLGIP
jgi:hypothetical protein